MKARQARLVRKVLKARSPIRWRNSGSVASLRMALASWSALPGVVRNPSLPSVMYSGCAPLEEHTCGRPQAIYSMFANPKASSVCEGNTPKSDLAIRLHGFGRLLIPVDHVHYASCDSATAQFVYIVRRSAPHNLQP